MMGAEWLGRLLARVVAPVWAPLLLIIVIYSSVAASLDEADWVAEDRVLGLMLLLGMAFGLAAARSRYRGGFLLTYILCMSVLFSIQAAAKIVPPPIAVLGRSLFDTINEMNLRGFEFHLRLMGWIDTLQAGGEIEDTGLFVLLLSFVLMTAGAWWMWATFRRGQALVGILPLGMLYGLHLHLSDQPLGYWMAFLACVLLLMAQTAFARQNRSWIARRVDYPDQLGLDWGAAAAALALGLVVIARLTPVFATEEGWRSLAKWLERSRQQTTTTAERLFSGVRPPSAPGLQPEPAVYVNTPDMTEIGAPIPQGAQTVMWVKISDPAPPRQDLPAGVLEALPPVRIHYWRSGLFAEYTGRGWTPLDAEAAAQEDDPPAETPGRYVLQQSYEIEAQHEEVLFSVNDPVQARGAQIYTAGDAQGHQVRGSASTYEVVSLATNVTANQLTSASRVYPAEIQTRYLQLPDRLPARVRDLSQRLAGDAPDPYAKALRIQTYLRETMTYDLSVGAAPAGRDIVDVFLFDQQRGFCSHYATAMAVMLRALGVPARVASGYAMGEYNLDREAYRVPVSLSHAWVEVYFPGYGWVEFEPTVARPEIRYPEVVMPVAAGQSSAPLVPEPDTTTQVLVVIGVVVLAALLLALPILLLPGFGGARGPVQSQVEALYRQIRRVLGFAGIEVSASMTPDEYLRSAQHRLEPYSQLAASLRYITDLYSRAVYSPRPPERSRLGIARQYWRSAFGEWLLLWLRERWHRLRR